MASQVTLYEFAKDNFKDTSSDLEDSLAEVEKICCGLVSSERSEVLTKPNRFFQPQLSYPLSQNLYALLEMARIKFIKNCFVELYQCRE